MICLDPLGIRRRTGAGRRGLLTDIDQRPTMNIIAEEICGIRWRLLQRDFSGRLLVVALRQKLGQTLPDGVAFSGRHHHRIHPCRRTLRRINGITVVGRSKPRPDRRRRRSRDIAFAPALWPTPGRQRYPPRPPTAVSPADGSPRSRCAAGSYRRPAGEGNRVSIPGPIRPSPGSQGLSATPRRCCRPAAGAGDRDIPAIRGDTRTNESINA